MLYALASARNGDWPPPLGCCPPVWASPINCLNLEADFGTELRRLISSTSLDVAPGTPRLAFGPASSTGEADTGFHAEETQRAPPPPPTSYVVIMRKKSVVVSKYNPVF